MDKKDRLKEIKAINEKIIELKAEVERLKALNREPQWSQITGIGIKVIRAEISNLIPFHSEHPQPVSTKFYFIDGIIIKYEYTNTWQSEEEFEQGDLDEKFFKLVID